MAVNKSPELKIGPATVESGKDPKNIAIGGMLMITGLFIITIPLGMFPGFTSEGGSETALLVIFGIVIAAMGTLFMFSGEGFRINLATRRIEIWEGPLSSRRSEPLESYKVIRVEKKEDSDSYTTWPVSLVGDNVSAITVVAPEKFADAMSRAKELSEYLDLPVEDMTLGTVTVIREAGRADESLSEKIRRMGEDVHILPPRPDVLKSKVVTSEKGISITVPHRKAKKIPIFRILLTLVVSYWGYLLIKWLVFTEAANKTAPENILGTYTFAGLAAFGLFVLLRFTLKDLCQRFSWTSRLVASPAILKIEENKGYRVSVKEILADHIQELVYQYNLEELGLQAAEGDKFRAPYGAPVSNTATRMIKHYAPRGITIVTATEKIKSCVDLPHEEVKYIYALIRKTLAGQ